jgi:redox-sensitive bicupin YhaK (pirin superfamily)
MSQVQLIIEERAADIGNFLVGRLLPFRQKRSIGPFVFVDHMGPVKLAGGENLDVGPHPHIGLSTLTFLFEGEIQHRDSLGSNVIIKPGAVNWMTAGHGVVHSERTPNKLRSEHKTVHGLQIWVALPRELEDMEPSFIHIEADAIPSWEMGGIHYKLIAGSWAGKISPVPVYSSLFFIELKAQEDEAVQPEGLPGEVGLYILEGQVVVEGHSYDPGQLLVAKESSLCSFEMKAGSTVYLLGGAPFPEDRHIYWNFVHSKKEKIEEAKERWKNHKFPTIPGDEGYVPLPQENPRMKRK